MPPKRAENGLISPVCAPYCPIALWRSRGLLQYIISFLPMATCTFLPRTPGTTLPSASPELVLHMAHPHTTTSATTTTTAWGQHSRRLHRAHAQHGTHQHQHQHQHFHHSLEQHSRRLRPAPCSTGLAPTRTHTPPFLAPPPRPEDNTPIGLASSRAPHATAQHHHHHHHHTISYPGDNTPVSFSPPSAPHHAPTPAETPPLPPPPPPPHPEKDYPVGFTPPQAPYSTPQHWNGRHHHQHTPAPRPMLHTAHAGTL